MCQNGAIHIESYYTVEQGKPTFSLLHGGVLANGDDSVLLKEKTHDQVVLPFICRVFITL